MSNIKFEICYFLVLHFGSLGKGKKKEHFVTQATIFLIKLKQERRNNINERD